MQFIASSATATIKCCKRSRSFSVIVTVLGRHVWCDEKAKQRQSQQYEFNRLDTLDLYASVTDGRKDTLGSMAYRYCV